MAYGDSNQGPQGSLGKLQSIELTLGSPKPLVDAQRSGQVKRLARQVLGAITDSKLLHLLPDTALGDRSRGY